MRRRIYEIVTKANTGDKPSYTYDAFMLLVILASILPLTFNERRTIFFYIEIFTTTVFIIDYILRWYTSDYYLKKKRWSFFIYPFTPMAIIDLLSILPGLGLISNGYKIFRVTRVLRIFRIFKILRYTDKMYLFLRVLQKERHVLFSVLAIALFYIFLTALIMFNVEPHINPTTGKATFTDFFDALYWATVTLTTVGYGDLCPVTDIGRCVSMLSSLFGVAIIALPSGVITASYLDELRHKKEEQGKH